MKLGCFSVSLNVQDLDASKAFYAALGFTVTGGDADQGWLILKNEDAVIGLFKGMIEQNTLTFNPGLSARTMGPVDGDADVREIQRQMRAAGVEPVLATDPDGTGAGHVVFVDPDGNPVLIDQFA